MGLNGGNGAPDLRVAWLIAGDEGEGVAQAVRGLAAAVRELGAAVVIVSISDGKFCRELRERGFEVRVLGKNPLPVLRGGRLRKVWLLARLLVAISRVKRSLARVLRELQVEAVHFLWPTFLPLAGPVAARLGIICIWEMANVPGKYPLDVNKWILQRCLRHYKILVLANSRYTAESIGDKPVWPVVLYPGADERRFDPAAVKPVSRADLGIPADAIVLGIFGRIVRLKGQLRVLQAMLQLKGLQPPLHLLLLGPERDAAYAAEIRATAAAGGVGERVHFAGSVPDPERYYGSVDIAVNAYLGAESFGLSVVEAMLMGKPVLAHRLGGPGETILDGDTGWLVEQPTVDAFRRGLERALADRARWAEMGAAGRVRALDNFSLRRQAAAYLKIVKDSVNRRAGPPPEGRPL